MTARDAGPLRTAIFAAGLSARERGGTDQLNTVLMPALTHLRRRLRVTACCAAGAREARMLADAFPAARIYRDHAALLGEHHPQVAVVAADPESQALICKAAILTGANVYSGTVDGHAGDDYDLSRLARANHVLTGSGGRNLHVPALRHARELVSGGYIGRPLFFSMSVFDDRAPGGGRDPAALLSDALAQLGWISGLEVAALNASVTALPSVRAGGRRAGAAGGVGSCFVRLSDGTKGVLQVSTACLTGGGERLELYGSEGMLMLTRPAHRPFAFHLAGARVDVGEILKHKTPPEDLKRRFRPLNPPRSEAPVSTLHMNRAWYAEALALSVFADAVRTRVPYAPDLLHRYKLGRVWLAAERAARARGWRAVDYGRAGAA